MAVQLRNTIKNWFKTDLIPTQEQFWDWIDSFRHKNEKVPVADIEGLDKLLTDITNIVGKPVCIPGQRMIFKHPTNNIPAQKYEQQVNDFVIGFVGENMFLGSYLGGEQDDEKSYKGILIDSLVSFITVLTYADLLQVNASERLIIIRVLNDENKTMTNTVYQLYPDGVRMWQAATKDN
ncbi:hypothetical protein DBR27_04360 [Flavobacterium sp. HMWF030]|nr:hypothetical protein DBR27_04360 [Flavobacterium sp. HMWF030]